MKTEIAFRLLAETLEWEDHQLAREFTAMQLMIETKYDHYQGFQPATRFHVALLGWLNQFESVEEKRIAFDFIKERLVYISQREMHHLVSLMMPKIEECLIASVACEKGIHPYQVPVNEDAQKRLKLLRRRTLFVGLSDGAKIDVLRRYNEGIVSNEQVVPFTEISKVKWGDLKTELEDWLKKPEYEGEQPIFEAICLVDDFTASGTSLIRQKEGVWKGKIPRFLESKAVHKQFLKPKFDIYVHHYLASRRAIDYIHENLAAYAAEHDDITFHATYSYALPNDVIVDKNAEPGLLTDLIEKYYDSTIEDEHKGCVKYGYKDGGLPLVLYHNTPNNSIALLWAASGKANGGAAHENSSPSAQPHKMKPLFPRRERHSSNG